MLVFTGGRRKLHRVAPINAATHKKVIFVSFKIRDKLGLEINTDKTLKLLLFIV